MALPMKLEGWRKFLSCFIETMSLECVQAYLTQAGHLYIQYNSTGQGIIL